MQRVRVGVIARLSAALRLEINCKLQDNLPAGEIAAWLLAEHAAELHYRGTLEQLRACLVHWRQGGFADWQRQQQRLEEMKAQQEFALQLARQNNGAVEQAALAMAASHIYEVLLDFDLRELKDKLHERPELYRLLIENISKLARLAQTERKLQLELQKYQDHVAEVKRKLEHELGTAKAAGLTPDTITKMEQALNLL